MKNKFICQSCGMPMKEEKDFGTNIDKTKNTEYCTFCYQDGSFTDEGISMKDKIENNIQIATEMGMDEKKARKLAEDTIPKLKRWQKQ
jgi:hypothetical protein